MISLLLIYTQVTLLKYFRSYMTEHLLKAGGAAGERAIEEGVRLPHLRAWFRTRSAIILHLSNGSLQVRMYVCGCYVPVDENLTLLCSTQINFFQDHTKVIICPLMCAVSYIDENKSFRTFRLPLIQRHGCSRELYSRLRYAKTMCERLIAKLDSQTTLATGKPVVTPTVGPMPTPTQA